MMNNNGNPDKSKMIEKLQNLYFLQKEEKKGVLQELFECLKNESIEKMFKPVHLDILSNLVDELHKDDLAISHIKEKRENKELFLRLYNKLEKEEQKLVVTVIVGLILAKLSN